MLKELIKGRRSVRMFTEKKISEEDIKKIIEAGIWAPSGCNNQELRFLVLKDMEEIKKFKPFTQGASHFILVFADMSLPGSKMYKNPHEANLQYIDTGLALQNMVIYAKSIGIASCICNLSDSHFALTDNMFKKIVNKIARYFGLHLRFKDNFGYILRNKFKMPEHLNVMCGVVLGYGKKEPDINTILHSGKKVMRKEVDHYLIK